MLAVAVVLVLCRRMAATREHPGARRRSCRRGRRSVGAAPDHDPRSTGASTAYYRVDEPQPGLHVLYSGTTIHGRETFAGPLAGEPLSYYHRAGPLGEVIDSLQAEHPRCGSGRSGWGRARSRPTAEPTDTSGSSRSTRRSSSIARGPGELHVPRRLAAHRSTSSSGTGGSASSRRRRRSFDLLVLDAFSSDAVPVHLLTVEALADRRCGRSRRAASSPSTSRTATSTSSRSSPRRRARAGLRVDHRQRPAAAGARRAWPTPRNG